LAKQFPTIKYRPDNYLGIEGRIRGINKSEIKDRDITAILQPRKGGKQFVSIPIQPDGDFLLPDLLFYDTVKIFYQLNNDKDRTLTTRANWDFSTNLMRESIGTSLPPKQELYVVRPDSSVILKSKAATQKFIDQQRKVQTLATVEVTAKQKSRKDKIESEYTSGLFSGGDANTFILEDDPAALGYQDVFSYLQGKVAGLQIISNGGSVSLSWRGGNPALFLDEMQQQDASMLQSMPMSNVALIKVFKPPLQQLVSQHSRFVEELWRQVQRYVRAKRFFGGVIRQTTRFQCRIVEAPTSRENFGPEDTESSWRVRIGGIALGAKNRITLLVTAVQNLDDVGPFSRFAEIGLVESEGSAPFVDDAEY